MLVATHNINTVTADSVSKFRSRFRIPIIDDAVPGELKPSAVPESQTWGSRLRWYFSGIAGVAIISAIGYKLQLSFAAVSLYYLLLIVVESLGGDFAACCVISLLALASLDYFFTRPVLSFRVADPLNILALVCFLVTALIITQLVAKVRDKAAFSYAQYQKTQQLYHLAQQLLATNPGEKSNTILQPFLSSFGLAAACVFDGESSDIHIAGESKCDLATRTGDAFRTGRNADDEQAGIVVRCIRVRGRITGAVGFEGLQDTSLTAGPLTALAAALLERAQVLRNANKAAAAAQTEAYRSVIVDALAHEFKTPLSTILAAAGALREAPALGPVHQEMAETVEAEAARLGRLTMRLIRTARLEQEEIRPWMELTHLSSMVSEAVAQYAKLSSNRRINVIESAASTDVLADPDLIRLAISQLLDNACKYSLPPSEVDLIVVREGRFVSLLVRSRGTPILSHEREQIFERFYRGVDARQTSAGTGLGLYVARKIAVAHGGNVELDSGFAPDGNITFRLTLPTAESETDDTRGTV